MALVSYKPQTAPAVIKLLYSQSLKTVQFGQVVSTVYNVKYLFRSTIQKSRRVWAVF